MTFSCSSTAMCGFWSSLGERCWLCAVSRSQMNQQRRFAVFLACVILPYMCAVLGLVWYMQAHPGPVPQWITFPMACYLIAACIGVIVFSRIGRKRWPVEISEEDNRRRPGAIKAIKTALVLYVVITSNAVWLVLSRKIPWNYAAPGLVVDVLLLFLLWSSWKRLKASSGTNPGGDSQQQ